MSGGVKLLCLSLTPDWECPQHSKSHSRHSMMVKPTVHELCYHPYGAVDLAAQEDWNDQASSTAYPACARLEVAPLLLCWLIIPTHWGRLCLLNICSQST